MTALGAEIAREVMAAVREDAALRDELRALLVPDESRTSAFTSDRKWLTVAEAARRLGCTADAIRMRCSRGRLEHRRQGRRLYVSAASVDQLG